MTPQHDDCTLGIQNRTRIEALERAIGSMAGDISDIRNKLLGRPSWAVCLVITTLVSAVVMMGMYILTHVQGA